MATALFFCFYISPNIFAHTGEIILDRIIRYSHNGQPLRFQIRVSLYIFDLPIRVIMLRSVQLNHKVCLCNIEIHNIATNDFLPVNR